MSINYCKVLIVEDEYIMRQGMKYMLQWEKEGFIIVGEATNGKEALELIEELKPNIIISDIVMPILNGVEFSKIVQNKYPEIQIIILSSYDNFEYVKSTLLNGAVDYILKPTLSPAQLLITLKKAVDRIPGLEIESEDENDNKILAKYLTNDNSSLDSKFITIFPNTCFRIFGLNIRQASSNNKDSERYIKTKIKRFFSSKKDLIFMKLSINDEVLCYIINYKISEDKDIVGEIEKFIIQNFIKEENIFFVITDRFDTINKIKAMYKNKFQPFLLDKFYYKDDLLLVTGKLTCVENIDKFNFAQYLNRIKDKEFELALNMVNEYMQYAVDNRFDEYKLKNLVKNLVYNFIVSLEDYDISADELRVEFFRQIDEAVDAKTFIDTIKKIVTNLNQRISEDMNYEENRIKDILDYINKHYNEPLDLSDISSEFNFNYYYISSYFNSHCKEGFSEYLNRIRITKACDLLKNKNISISEVSSIVGYSDHSYFCRVFKKLKGYTPSSYRRINKIKGV